MALSGIITINKPEATSKIGVSIDDDCVVVTAAGLSAESGLKVGDKILEIDGEAMTDKAGCLAKLKELETLPLKVKRIPDKDYTLISIVKPEPDSKVGFSCEVNPDGTCKVTAANGLSEAAGLEVGDTIIGVGDALTFSGKADMLALVKGSEETVLLTVLRGAPAKVGAYVCKPPTGDGKTSFKCKCPNCKVENLTRTVEEEDDAACKKYCIGCLLCGFLGLCCAMMFIKKPVSHYCRNCGFKVASHDGDATFTMYK
mmetsp:Transcript_5288/g.7838  ORF Transcript_5288/g.7838 Transcript_5288/m.7838 type:complete len:257 (+) Transcript_5288:152-922(+)|eukprot:CAMPEP_0196802396 /NCGR_PEP_ID=MMETSP1362-20130617/2010_1 /TAXON_ID=163516 /ORGANISM="Leptocylindrus danicus, Strain CCMP1856" /LENGTH=256 /DNA_ID=CAMNT_0042173677 /DNA_START=188 /DNA_END=958 /DNA_ORIENTATION=-